jgi:hypothetical protein
MTATFDIAIVEHQLLTAAIIGDDDEFDFWVGIVAEHGIKLTNEFWSAFEVDKGELR